MEINKIKASDLNEKKNLVRVILLQVSKVNEESIWLLFESSIKFGNGSQF